MMSGISALYNLRPLNVHYVQKIVSGIVVGIIGISIWLVPIYQTFHGYQGFTGFNGYFQRLDNHRQHIQSADSLFRQELNTVTITRRINAYVDGW